MKLTVVDDEYGFSSLTDEDGRRLTSQMLRKDAQAIADRVNFAEKARVILIAMRKDYMRWTVKPGRQSWATNCDILIGQVRTLLSDWVVNDVDK